MRTLLACPPGKGKHQMSKARKCCMNPKGVYYLQATVGELQTQCRLPRVADVSDLD